MAEADPEISSGEEDAEGSAAAAQDDAGGDSKFFIHTGPNPKTKYPVRVLYCDGM